MIGKLVLFVMFMPLALFGAQVMPLPTLSSGAMPNSEVVTNITLNVDYASAISRSMRPNRVTRMKGRRSLPFGGGGELRALAGEVFPAFKFLLVPGVRLEVVSAERNA